VEAPAALGGGSLRELGGDCLFARKNTKNLPFSNFRNKLHFSHLKFPNYEPFTTPITNHQSPIT
jgi:hypothetical protein